MHLSWHLLKIYERLFEKNYFVLFSNNEAWKKLLKKFYSISNVVNYYNRTETTSAKYILKQVQHHTHIVYSSKLCN